MIVAALVSGASLGLGSALHCAAMCGPLCALSCSKSARRTAVLRYQAGRTLSYGAAGAFFGQLGLVVHSWFQALGAWPLILASCAACLFVARSLVVPRAAEPGVVRLGVRLGARGVRGVRTPAALLSKLARLLPEDPFSHGALSVLLPCGALLAALLVAMAQGSALGGALVMLGFVTISGAALFFATMLTHVLSQRASLQVRRLSAVLLVGVAIASLVKPVFALVDTPEARDDASVTKTLCH